MKKKASKESVSEALRTYEFNEFNEVHEVHHAEESPPLSGNPLAELVELIRRLQDDARREEFAKGDEWKAIRLRRRKNGPKEEKKANDLLASALPGNPTILADADAIRETIYRLVYWKANGKSKADWFVEWADNADIIGPKRPPLIGPPSRQLVQGSPDHYDAGLLLDTICLEADRIVHRLLDVQAVATPNGTGKPARSRKATCNMRMADEIQNNHDAMEWTVTEWQRHFKKIGLTYGRATIHDTLTWQNLESYRLDQKAHRRKDRRKHTGR